ncbi:MAG: prolyl oligopeptidase family serine peptidase [Chloroflexota bacterium]|nr:prolyl oligopeptidase family serine peptidase [Chloroflexota bacterium]
MAEPAWRRRFRAARVGFPLWARERPDRLIYLSNESGKHEVHAWDRARDARRQVSDRPEGTGYRVPSRIDPGGDDIWSWNDAKGDEFGTWTVEPFAGGSSRDAAPLEASFSAGLALGHGVAVIGRSDDDGTTVHVVPRGDRPLQVYAHPEHAVVRELSADETLFALDHSEHGDARNRAVRILDLTGHAVAQAWDGPGCGLTSGEWSPIPGDQRLIVGHERRGRREPMVFSPLTGEQRQLAIDLPGEVFARWSPDASALLLIHEHRGRSELHRLDLASGATSRLPCPAGTVDDARVRPDGEVWYRLTSSAEPPAVRDARGVVLTAPGDPAPPGVCYSDVDVGGVHAFVAAPPGAGPHPAMFLVHGGPEAHDSDGFSPQVQAWVDHGFAVLLANYRGSSGYGKAWRDALRGDPGFTELADLAAVRDWAVAGGLADPDRCVIGGGSWGGYLTLLALGTQPQRWSLGIAGVPIADYIAAYEDEMEPLRKYDRAIFGGTPAEVPELYRERSPITYVERVRVPVMILAGANDPRCPIRQIENYVARLRELGKPHEVYRYEAGHGSLVIDEQLRQLAAQIDFAARHLGTTAVIGA